MLGRETTQQHFGKRGIVWHRFLASYCLLEDGEDVCYTVYCDQVLDGTSKQDNLAVGTMTECFLLQLKQEITFLESVTLQSNNAGCYHSNELLLLLPIISEASAMKASWFIHTKRKMVRNLFTRI